MNLNKAMVIGNLTRDPEIKTTPAGISVATFSVATSMVWKDQNGQKQEKPEFHNMVAWRRLADIIGQYLKKGSKVYIEGRLQTRDWVGQDGVKRNRTEIIVENMIMLDRPAAAQAGSYSQPNTGSQPYASTATYSENIPTQEESVSSDDDIKVEDIPF